MQLHGPTLVAASDPKILSLLLSLSGVTPFSFYVSSGEKRDMNINPVALASVVPPSVLQRWDYPFHLAVSPQTLSRPTFPIHSLSETLRGSDQVAYDNLYNTMGLIQSGTQAVSKRCWDGASAAPPTYTVTMPLVF